MIAHQHALDHVAVGQFIENILRFRRSWKGAPGRYRTGLATAAMFRKTGPQRGGQIGHPCENPRPRHQPVVHLLRPGSELSPCRFIHIRQAPGGVMSSSGSLARHRHLRRMRAMKEALHARLDAAKAEACRPSTGAGTAPADSRPRCPGQTRDACPKERLHLALVFLRKDGAGGIHQQSARPSQTGAQAARISFCSGSSAVSSPLRQAQA